MTFAGFRVADFINNLGIDPSDDISKIELPETIGKYLNEFSRVHEGNDKTCNTYVQLVCDYGMLSEAYA